MIVHIFVEGVVKKVYNIRQEGGLNLIDRDQREGILSQLLNVVHKSLVTESIKMNYFQLKWFEA